MKRYMGILLVLAGLSLFSAPCVQAAAGGGASTDAAALQKPVQPIDLSEGDIDYDFTPMPVKRLTLAERLLLQNAICVLWHNSMKQDPAPVESLDLMELDAPDHIFVHPTNAFFFHNGEWVFEGHIRQMAPDNTGIEVISGIQYFNVQFQRLENGKFFPAVIHFGPVGAS